MSEQKSKYALKRKSEWNELSLPQLYDLKTQMANLYFDMRYSGATFASQYLGYANEIDSLISRKEAERGRERINTNLTNKEVTDNVAE